MSVSAGSSPLSSPEPDENLLLQESQEEDNEVSSLPHTTQRLKDMNLKEVINEEKAEVGLSEATSPPPSLTNVLKQVLAKKENAQTAYLLALNSANVDDGEADRLRDVVSNLEKHIKTLSNGLKSASIAAAAVTKASANLNNGLKISKRDLPKFQLEDNKTKPFPVEDAYKSVDHFLSEFEKIVFSSGQDIETVWRKYIPLTLSYELDDWMKTVVLKAENWEGVKSVFSKKFGTVVSRIHKRRAVMNMEIGFDETVDEYSNRFFRTVGEAGYHRDDLTIGDIFLLSLPEEWQLNICTVLLSNTKRQAWTTGEIHNAAIDLLGEKTPQSWFASKGESSKRKFAPEKRIAMSSSTSLTSNNIPTLPKARMLGDKNLPNKASSNPCRFCGRQWKHGHTCEEYRAAKKQKVSSSVNVLTVSASNNKEENEAQMLNQAINEVFEDDTYPCRPGL
ncbi:hypothetical protein BD408DRAFT_438667 [Parasitella parasitica]|nr:hypothetical protein BD408DRAFT_438667 [Parasitella parasitica]